MALYPVAGCKIYIGDAAVEEKEVDWVEADFAAVTWVEISKWVQMGAFGDAASLITTDLISEARTKKQKGTRNAGSMENVFTVDATNAGQIQLLAAEASELNYPFRVVLNDAPAAGVAPAPGERKFIGLVMSAQEQGGGANTIRNLNATVEINSNIVRLAATSGA